MGLLGFIATSQTFVSTTPENRNVVLEEFTGIYCQFCPDGHLIAQGLHNTNPNDVFLINIHTGGYSNPNGPSDPDFNTLFGGTIANNSGLTGYPAGTVNRSAFTGITPQGGSGTTALSRGDWTAAAADVLAQSSYVNVAAQASYDMSTGILTVNTETYFILSATNANTLHVAVTQNNVPGPQTGALTYNPGGIITGPWNPTYNHQHMFRHLMDGANGLEYNVTSAGTFVPNTHTWQMPNNLSTSQSTNGYFPDLDPTNLKVVAYIVDNGGGEIVTGYEAAVIPIFPNSYDANVTSSTSENVVCANETDISITFRNYGNQNLTSLDLTYDINNGTPALYNWTGNLTSGSQETVTLNNVTFTPQANNTVTWVASNPNGQVDQNTTNNSSSSFFSHWNLSGNVINNIDAGTIDISILTDNYGSETTWEVVGEDGTVYGSGGPYNNTTQYNETAYVPSNSCFEFKLYDSFGDGMCCQQGVGSVIVTDQSNNTIFEGDPVNLQSFTELSAFFETGMGSSNSWECTPFGCADVGIGMGTYATQFDCESDSTNVNTPCFVMTSVNEIANINQQDNKMYDVLGRELSEVPSGKMYIKNGIIYIK
tara:strand:- start:876 stop:2663 length:1788 start_codon:yes stop_codon:yes gene_type:complete